MNRKPRILPSTIVSSAIALVVLFASTALFASTPQGSFERTLQVSGPVDLEVQTHSGNITVRAGSSGSVSIRAKIFVGNGWFEGKREGDVHSIEQNPPIHQQGNSIRVENVDARNISIDYEITVPVETAVRAHSGSGDQILEGTHGNADIGTGSGDLKLAHLTGEVHVQTGSGNVRAHEISGPVHGGTGSGDVEIEETGSGDVELHTGSATSQRAACRAASAARRAAETLPRKARRPARGIFTPGQATFASSCQGMQRLTPTFRPVRDRLTSARRSRPLFKDA